MAASQRHQQPERSCGKMIPSEFSANSIRNMTAVQTHVLGVTDSGVDFSCSARRLRTHYLEHVIRHPVPRGVRGLSRHQVQNYVIVTEFTWFEKPKRPDLVVHKLLRHPEHSRGSRRYERAL